MMSTTDDAVLEEKKRLLSEILNLTESFESVQRIVKSNAKLYKENMDLCESRINELEEKVQKANKIAEANDEMVVNLEKTKKSMSREISSLKRSIQENKKKDSDLEGKTRTQQLEEDVRKATSIAEGNEETIAKLKQTKESMSKEIDNLKALIEEKEKFLMERNDLAVESRTEELEHDIETFKTLLDKKGEMIAKLKHDREEISAEITELKNSFKEREIVVKEQNDPQKKSDMLGKINKANDQEGTSTISIRQFIDAKSTWSKEREDLTRKACESLEEKDDALRALEGKVFTYEKERKSLRKLTWLGLKRIGSFFRFKR